MLSQIFTGWHFMRWLRLAAGMMLGWQAMELQDSVYGFIAVFLLLQAVTDTGCCGASCASPVVSQKDDDTEPEFEYINPKTK